MYCKNCGKQIEPTFKFCNQCGYPLAENENGSMPESIFPAQVCITEDTAKKKPKKSIIVVLILFLFISVASAIMFLISDSNDADTVLPQTSNTNQEVENQETTETTTTNIFSEIPVIFDAKRFSYNTTINEIMNLFPSGIIHETSIGTDADGNEIIVQMYWYQNYSFNFYEEKLQSIFIDYTVAGYTDPTYCPEEPLVCSSIDEFLPTYGLSGGTITDTEGYLYMADNCGIYKFVCFHNGANIRSVELCYTDLFISYN